MRRRAFLGVLSGVAATWPLGALAQQGQRMRRIGVLMNLAADDKEGQARLIAFVQALADLGWKNTSNVKIETCWGAGDTERFDRCAAELVAHGPDVILAASASTMDPLLKQTRSIPIVFAQVPDPVGSGYVASLARPGGNVTGFTQFDFSITSKWLGLLKTVEPSLTRALVLRDLDSTGAGQFGAIQAAAHSGGVEVIPAGWRPRKSHFRFCQSPERRLSRNRKCTCRCPSRPNYYSCGSTQTTRDLPIPIFRSRWWSHLLWANYDSTLCRRGRLRGPHS